MTVEAHPEIGCEVSILSQTESKFPEISVSTMIVLVCRQMSTDAAGHELPPAVDNSLAANDADEAA